MKKLTIKIIDRMLWYAISGIFVILVIASFIRNDTYQAFIDVKSSSLQFDISGQGVENEIIDFGNGAIVVEDVAGRVAVNSFIKQIKSVSGAEGLILKSVDSAAADAQLCLVSGEYFIYLINPDSNDAVEQFIAVRKGQSFCLQVKLLGDFVVMSDNIMIMRFSDLYGVNIFPQVSGVINIQGTQKKIQLTNGDEIIINLLDDSIVQVSFANGLFGVYTKKRIKSTVVDNRNNYISNYYTPLDVLRKYMEDNSLWYSVSLIIGAVFGLRKVLQLRL